MVDEVTEDETVVERIERVAKAIVGVNFEKLLNDAATEIKTTFSPGTILDQLYNLISDGTVRTSQVVARMCDFVPDDDDIEAAEKYAEHVGLVTNGSLDAKHPIVETAAQLAFANPFQVGALLEKLREEFRRCNVNSIAQYNQLDMLE